MTVANPLPLAGIQVLELGQLIAEPFCARILGDFGAEVIKVEPPGSGDPLRNWRHLRQGTSLWWQAPSRNKKSVAIDLRHPDGQAIVRRLAARSDIVIENFRPGTLEQWGLGYETLREGNPGLQLPHALPGRGEDGVGERGGNARLPDPGRRRVA